MAKASVVLLVVLTSAIGACSAVTDQWNDLIGEAPPAPAPALAATERDEVFYASVEELPMHALPSGSSDIVARLALHQRVTRIGLARGYANVTTESGIVGWVDNVNLLWRLPATPTPSTAPAAPVPPPEAEQAPAAPRPNRRLPRPRRWSTRRCRPIPS